MKARILHFRQNRHDTYGNQMIVAVEGVDNREKAAALVGKKTVFKTQNGEIDGEVASAHGNKGVLRVRFSRGMPGQSLGQELEIKS
jgi:large subunit ribosomal protein L35Ae